MNLQVFPSDKPLGAEIRGADLSVPLSASEVAAIQSALNQYSVIYFRGQRLAPPQQIAFTRNLGELQSRPAAAAHRLPEHPDILVISNIVENGKPIGVVEAGQYWHSDIPYAERPPAYSCLHAIEVPHDEQGRPVGDMMFVSSGWAYETLDESLRQRISGLEAYPTREKRNVSTLRRDQMTEFDNIPGRTHPVVRVHPVTGRKGIYVNATYTANVVGLAEYDSRQLLDALCRHITRPEVCFRHHWQVGDVLIWDDCAVQHHAVADYALPQRRLMHRTTVEGTVPFGVRT